MDTFIDILGMAGLLLILVVSVVGTGITIFTGLIDMYNNRQYRKNNKKRGNYDYEKTKPKRS